ncbi:hypothetical protein [Embleya hyalina]|uniref:hypothetical protein n=1 Tax=Embleya hyalina TaxID=516124 RepID=UPI000F84E0C4|nr:hypothetical protein [Embleya hyalina]
MMLSRKAESMDYVERLASSGLVFLRLVSSERPLIPPTLATLASGYLPEEWPRSIVDSGDPDFVGKANKGWFDLSREGGLFGDDREFLVAVEIHDSEDSWWWAHVRLAEVWDIVGAGSAAALGNDFGAPEFAMLSLTGDVIVCGVTGESSIGTVLVNGFRDLAGLRELADWQAGWLGTPEQERIATRRWLECGDS